MTAKALTKGQAATVLRNLGWRVRNDGELRQAVTHFQQGWNLGPSLKDDGDPGPLTSAALRISESRRRKGLPTASAHFSFVEVACKCRGKYAGCARIWMKRNAFGELEDYRKAKGSGVSIVSGNRCWAHNKAVKGATSSQHMAGDAADFPPEKSTAWFAKHGLFHGRGYNPGHLVRHGDMRSGHVTWPYSS
jgi:zinc D-Ala-D-Ala carboxypeptidase